MKFSPDAVASQLEDVYQKAIEARTRQL